MKNILRSALLTIILSFSICAQSNWTTQTSGTNSLLQEVFFIDENNGWASGAGPILHTSDGNTHNTLDQKKKDTIRQKYLEYFNIKFVRIKDEELLGNTNKVFSKIENMINSIPMDLK